MRKKIAIIRLISLFSGVYFWLFAGISAYAKPQGPQVVHGQAGFSNPNPQTLNVTNSPNAIINWQGFSIQSHEVTRFIQQSPNSAVLNRVTGPNPSSLLGQLLSNGKVFLINPHGMVFGRNCVIDTAGFVASTLNITDQDFLQGNLKFEGGPDSGSIVNQGFITAGKNGDIYLIAPNIENSGIIHTEGGNLLLAAGESITITSLDLKDVHFEIQAPENEVLNIGKVLADGGAVNVFAGTLKHSGEIRADTVSVDETGTITLTASKDIILEPDSIVSASGTPGGVHDGGEVRIIAQDTLDFQRGAEIRVDGGPDGGDGGYLELSGKQKIALNGVFSGNAQTEGYRNGSLFIDPANINLTSTGISGSIVVGSASREIAVSPDSSTVYVVVSGAASVVKVIDAASDTVINTISVGSFSEGIAMSSDGNYVYVTNNSSDNISVISTATQTVVKTLAVGNSPNNITVRPDTNRAYVTNGLDDNVSVIDTSDPPNASVITTISVGDNPRNIAVTPDGSKVYVSNRNDNNVSVINTGSNSVIGTINVGTNPRKIAAGPLGSDRIYVCNYLSNNVSVINTSTDTVIATPAAGGNPQGAAVSPDGSYLYVTNYGPRTLTILDTGSYSVVDTLTVGNGPRGIAASPDRFL